MGKPIPQAKIDRIRRLCEVHSMTEVAGIVGVGRHVIGDMKRRGWKEAKQPCRLRPADFAILSVTMTKQDLMRHYRAGSYQVRRWSGEVGRQRKQASRYRPAMPIPTDLAAIVAELGPYGAADHYGVSYGTVKRWRKATGLPFSWSRQPKRVVQTLGWAERYFQERRAA